MLNASSAALLLACWLAGPAQASSDGEIDFVGEIIAAGCDVVPSSAAQTVDLGRISLNSFSGAGSTVGAASFAIELNNCHPDLTSVGVVFDGTSTPEDPALLALQGSNSAKGVGIALYEGDGTTPLALHTPSAPVVLDGAPDAVLHYVAKYKSLGETPVAGEARAVASFTLVYN